MEQLKWAIEMDGSIAQSLGDIQDSDIRLFTEVARSHNQAIIDSKKKAE